jgi:hypothetical protein
MKITTNQILILFGVIALAIMACLPISIFAMPLIGLSQPDPSKFDSAATLQAMVAQTMTAQAPHASPTPTLFLSTPVPAHPTNTPVPTAVSYCDWAAFVKDVSIPDGTLLSPGETFTKIWRLQNRGTCTWTPDYDLVYYGGAQMSGTTMQVPGYVAPGQYVDVAVTLTAPSASGHYEGFWLLRNANGGLFGTGAHADETFYVDIRVKDIPHGEVTGNICYPSEFNPPVTLYFENKDTNDVIQFAIPARTPTYRVLLPTGTYYAHAWASTYGLEGAYVDQNFLMKSFDINSGQLTVDIDLCDWSPTSHARGD